MTHQRITTFAVILAVVTLFTGFTLCKAQADELKDLEGPYSTHPDIASINDKIKAKAEEIDSLNESIRQYKEKIEQARGQAVTLSSQLNLIDSQITKTELDIKTTQLSIDKTKLEMESINSQSEKEQAEIDVQKERLKEYIRNINREDQRTLLEVLIVNENFSEFFKQVNYLVDVQAELKTSVDRLKLLKNALDVKKVALNDFKGKTESQKKSLEEQRAKLSEQSIAKESLLYETKHSELSYQNLLEEAHQEQSDVDSSINSLKDEVRRKLERLRTGDTNPKSTLLYWPVDPGRGITTYFNDPDYPFRYLFEHSALDIRAYQGTPIKAPADGYVARAHDGGYGYSYITLVHDNNLSTVYGHVLKIYVKADQFVKAGEVIGLSGAQPGTPGAGRLTTGPHLHFEVRLNGIPVDPMQYLP